MNFFDRRTVFVLDSTMHPLTLSRRTKGWDAKMEGATPRNSASLTEAGRESTKANMRHLFANECAPQIKSFFLDGLVSEHSSTASSSAPPVPTIVIASKAPNPQDAGKGLVRADDDYCKPGAKVKIAFSFSMEDWARPLEGKIGTLVHNSPVVESTWRVKFDGVPDLVDCSVGLMGRSRAHAA